MKIPFTIWWSKERKTLEQISRCLEGKEFSDLTNDMKEEIELLNKLVDKHYHNSFSVVTDAISSTYIDLDEINMTENHLPKEQMGEYI